MTAILLYMTAASEDEAEAIARALLDKKLIACANIMQPHKALYRWDGEIQSGSEIAVIMKSQAQHFEAIEAVVKDLHSYDVPCLVQLPIENGHEPFLNWISENLLKN